MKPTDNSSELITHPPDRLFSSGFGSLGVKGLSRTCTSSMTGAIPRVGGLQSAHRKIIGPFFFENENGITVTVNSERYIVILERFWEELEAKCGTRRTRQYLQQDGATSHTANITIKWLKDHFKSRIISKKCAIEWPPLSPDLSPPDYFLWGFLKDRVYASKPRNIAQLKEKIIEEIGALYKKRCSP